MWHDGRETIVAAIATGFDPDSPHYLGDWRVLPTGSNLQPAAAFYLRRPGDSRYSEAG
jgi:RNA polymerase sigma-70 factor (ECF subfamily)